MNIRELILKDMPNNLNDLEKARYVYLKLGDIVDFSTKYNNTSLDEMGLMYTSNIDVTNIKNNQVNCRFWVQIYSSILTELGIENTINGGGHQCVLFKANGKVWFADATTGKYTDLARIKYGDETTNFGIALRQNFNDDYNAINLLDEESNFDSIDSKFDFYIERKEKLRMLKERLSILKTSDPLMTKCIMLFKMVGELKSGYYEARDFLYTIEKCVLTEEEISRVHVVPLKKTKNDLEVDIIDVIYVYDDGYRYFLMEPNKPIRRVTKEEIIEELPKKGYGIDKDKKIPNIDYYKIFIPGEKSKEELSYKISKNNIFSYILSKFKKESDYSEGYNKHTITRR